MSNNKSDVSRSAKIALLGVLGAQALVLSYFENLIPAFPGLPPGAKPGFSNIITMFAVSRLGLGNALFITLLKALFAGLTRGATAFFMSITGGILSTLTMALLMRKGDSVFGYAGIGILCAAAHNVGQLAVCVILTGTKAILGYAPVLLLFALITGFVTGTILKYIMPAFDKQQRFFTKNLSGSKPPKRG